MTKPVVAIVGRPNVGKSTLFNRLFKERRAIVEDAPGTTRDRLYADVSWNEREITLVDTGGLEITSRFAFTQKIRQQVEMAITEADVILFLVDAREGVTSIDMEIADLLRRSQKQVVLVANKVDSPQYRSELFQFYELSMGDPLPLSAYHGKGIDDLIDYVEPLLPSYSPTSQEAEPIKAAIVGRPNVGKSMLLNALLGQERVIVDDSPGTTRDAIDTLVEYGEERILFIDTAGMRRRGRIEQGIEQHSMIRVFQAIERADIALLVIDASEPFTAQDIHILGHVHKASKGAIVVVNKWDLVEEGDKKAWVDAIRRKIKFMPYVLVAFTSAKTGYGVEHILPLVKKVYEQRLIHPDPDLVEAAIREATIQHPPPAKGLGSFRIFHVTQTGVNPPTFSMVVDNVKPIHFSYRRYLENQLRHSFGFEGTPLCLQFKSKKEKQHGN